MYHVSVSYTVYPYWHLVHITGYQPEAHLTRKSGIEPFNRGKRGAFLCESRRTKPPQINLRRQFCNFSKWKPIVHNFHRWILPATTNLLHHRKIFTNDCVHNRHAHENQVMKMPVSICHEIPTKTENHPTKNPQKKC